MVVIEFICFGVDLREVDFVVWLVIDKVGFGKRFGYGFGYGFGLEIYEEF